MKIQKFKTTLLSLLLALSLNNTYAQSFVPVEKSSQELISTNDKLVDNSMLNIVGTLPLDVKWLMIVVTKNDFKEKLTLAVSDGIYQTRISLQDGPGLYDIALYINNSTERYTSYIQYKKYTIENTDPRDMSFLLPTFKVQVEDARIQTLVQNLTVNAQDDEEAFLAIYKYVTSTIKYDHASLKDGSYVNKDYNAINTLLDSKAVCEGYSNLLAAMSRAYGIRTKVVFGQALLSKGKESHAWNEVFIHDEWKIVDATWDAGHKFQKYLFINEKDFSRDHEKEMEMQY